jgi:tetratricopeptide (TPR) repeat protein
MRRSIDSKRSARRLMMALGLVFSAGRAEAASESCFDDWWRGQVESLNARPLRAEALLTIRQLETMRSSAHDPGQLLEDYERWRQQPTTDPLIASELDAFLLWNDLARGDRSTAEQRAARLGVITQYWLSPPLRNAEELARLYPALSEQAAGSNWRGLDARPLGTVPFEALMTPNESVRAAAVSYLEVERRTKLAVRFGADDNAQVSLDGTVVFGAEPGESARHDLAFDQHALFLELEPGYHRLAFEVDQDRGAWGLHARLTKLDGTELDDSVRVLPVTDAARVLAEQNLATSKRSRFKRLEFGRSLLHDLQRSAEDGGALARVAYAIELNARRLPARSDSSAVDLARAALQSAPHDARVLWVHAAVDPDAARRRATLTSWLAREPNHPVALRGLIHYHSSFSQMRETLAVTTRALDACSQPDPYLETWRAIARDGDGFPTAVVGVLERLEAAYPRQPAVVTQLASYAKRDGFRVKAERALFKQLELSQTDTEARLELAALWLATDRVEQGLQLLEDGIRLLPLQIETRQRLATALQRLGRVDQAIRIVTEARALAPDHPGLTVLYGECLLTKGDRKGAATAFRAAREWLGEDGALDARIAALTGVQEGFGPEWTMPLERALQIEQQHAFAGDPAWVVLAQVAAWRVQPDGRHEEFRQVIARVRHADKSDGARQHSVTYSPTLQRASIVEARLIRRDGTSIPAARGEQPILPDEQLRMWYDSRALFASFPRLEDGDLIDVRFALSDRGTSNPMGDGYFGQLEVLGREVPVLSSRLVVDTAAALPVQSRLIQLDDDGALQQRDQNGRRVTIHDLGPLPAVPQQPFAPPGLERVPYALLGAVPSWQQLGQMYSRLISDSMTLDLDVREATAKIVASKLTRRQIVRAVYDWVIENTRYVALEFGINAIKPYAVPLVHKRRHGDCKDKAALMVAMLREAGVKANIALVRTRDRGKIDSSIPVYAAFDHAIVYVPGEDLWLDGTVLHHTVDELPTGDRGIQALLITEDRGGVLTTTPEPRPENAASSLRQEIRVESSGDAVIGVEALFRGEFAARERSRLRGQDQPGRTLLAVLREVAPEVNLIQADFGPLSLDRSEVKYSYRAHVPRYGQPTGHRLELPLALVLPRLGFETPAPGRPIPFQLPEPAQHTIEASIVLPPGAKLVEQPANAVAEAPWGRVSVNLRPQTTGVAITIEYSLSSGVVPVERIAQLGEFAERVRQILAQRLIVELP